MMFALRHINPFYSARLEREIATLRKRHETMRADVVTYYDMTSRQLDPRSDPALLARVFRAENDLSVARLVIFHALTDMRAGRQDAARAGLEAALGEAHAEPGPIHLVDRVA
jgi:hypothetical protein